MRIAKEWNVRDNGSSCVTRFAVRKTLMETYPVPRAEESTCTESWIAAGDLEELNDNIVGKIEAIRRFAA